METQSQENSNEMPNFNWEKRTRQIFKFTELEKKIKQGKAKGPAEFVGKLTGTRERVVQDVNEETGEVTQKPIMDICLTAPDGSLYAIGVDTGLKIALSSADVDLNSEKVKPVWLKIVRGEKQDLGGKKKVNTYEIFTAPVQ